MQLIPTFLCESLLFANSALSVNESAAESGLSSARLFVPVRESVQNACRF